MDPINNKNKTEILNDVGIVMALTEEENILMYTQKLASKGCNKDAETETGMINVPESISTTAGGFTKKKGLCGAARKLYKHLKKKGRNQVKVIKLGVDAKVKESNKTVKRMRSLESSRHPSVERLRKSGH